MHVPMTIISLPSVRGKGSTESVGAGCDGREKHGSRADRRLNAFIGIPSGWSIRVLGKLHCGPRDRCC